MEAMKKVLVMSVFLASLMVGAKNIDPKPAMEIKSLNSGMIALYVAASQSNTMVIVKDVHGEILHKEKLSKGKGYKKKYDISQLPSGDYYFKIVSKESTKVYLFNRNEFTLVLDESNTDLRIKRRALAAL